MIIFISPAVKSANSDFFFGDGVVEDFSVGNIVADVSVDGWREG